MNIQRLSGLGQALVRDQRGITGLETAIILIAFVVVASVFAFTVLSTGLFSSERGKETILSGLDEARGSPALKGSVMAYRADVDLDGALPVATGTGVVRARIVLTNGTGGIPVDMTPRLTLVAADPCDVDGEPGAGQSCYDGNKYTVNTDNVVVINYRDENQRVSNLEWHLTWLGGCQQPPCDSLLERGEAVQVTAWLHPQRDLHSGGGFTLGYVEDGEGGDATGQHLSTLMTTRLGFTLEVVPPQGAVLQIVRNLPAEFKTVMNLKVVIWSNSWQRRFAMR